MEVLSRKGCKNIDNYTIKNIGIPSIVLMENAANGIVSIIRNLGNKVIIFCGTGNNGGDGLAVARKLWLLKKDIEVILVGNIEKLSEETRLNLNIINSLNIPVFNIKNIEEIQDNIMKKLSEADYVIDSIFGIGLNREVRGIYKDIINLINKYSNYVVSIDIPSGMDADTGEILGCCINADITCSVEVMKKGFISNKAVELLGKIEIINIDIPDFVKEKNSEKTYILSNNIYKDMIPLRDKTGHKGNYGKVLIVAGSEKYCGAAFISTEACVRTGSGLVTLLTHKDSGQALKVRLTEAMIQEYLTYNDVKDLRGFDIIACGPGFSLSEDSKAILDKIINETSCKLVLDADALNIISKNKNLLKKLKGKAIVTPHPGEMARLIGNTISYVEANRIEVAKKFAKENNIIVLLKGYNTIITDGERVFINPTGNSKMASGGMGDCLTGIITSFVGQGLNLLQGTLLGAYVHGFIGDELSKESYIVNARDIISELPKTIEKLCEK
ncbi:NAD(P)H-hydrate epimerase [Clostridium moniliforme]|uniref:Bifunctional NAD(P)H-hydrate repair enzyme n=1 Tax=Clostridium moniliforme TaxID=39489 RepID=A0ABS4F2E9_9CLOT|nr:NAD(P)H-hydrate dehydratase [Clostridium moniliforme]MBP1890426.1 NAD(P)H-hydrate epimerase [Clostridium moniliforme]